MSSPLPTTDSPDNAAFDGTLLRVLRGGDPAAAAAVHRRYARRVVAVARANMTRALGRRVDPEDIAQSVFRRFFTAVRAGRYDLPTGDELWELLLVFTLNRVRTAELHHRAEKRDVRVTVEWGDEEPAAPADPAHDDAAVESTLVDAVAAAVADLPDAGRAVVELRMAGYGVGEIAATTGRSRRTVERLLQDTRTRLRSALQPPPEPAHADAG